MARFKFRLQKILELRKRKQEDRQKELAGLKKLLKEEEKLLEKLKKQGYEVRKKIDLIQSKKENSLDMEELTRHSDYLDSLRNRILSQIRTIRKVIEDIENKRGELIDASKEKKIIETLKEQQYKKFRESLENWEKKRLDEFGMINYSHRRDNK
ncbi:MAG: flagellar export protein FliJ [Candidatus Omnitrophica bacterium]|nr:flagellar export protein FliJ [Candidatus Omnitrophota bacterium]MBD3269878.1 flagellar export protein FliJ [Candidatus Omnitrophota bacterium]